MEWIDVPAKGLTLRDIRRITRRDQAESEDIRKAANEKLQKINEAKERIYKARGMK